ncbi:YolD-like family protein [Fictibacillus iocasae]|uniref:YolD-like family protein n=1 Tax=Fictibacillus iocasae TaxID=2715437 RepID=A0ABW2NNF4_9BACL
MIRDRGNIKWTSMMLPEHVKLLRTHEEEADRMEQPHMDEQKQEEWEELLCEAMAENRMLRIDCYKDGRIVQVEGAVHFLDEIKKEIRIITVSGQRAAVKTASITEMRFSE